MKNASVVKLIAIVMCALFLIQGTLAWQNIRQTAVNEMFFESDYSPVRLVKMEKYADGTKPETPVPLPGARFILKQYGTDDDPPSGQPVNGTEYVTDSNGEIRLDIKLPQGKYVFVETACPPGYTYDVYDETAGKLAGQNKTYYVFEVSGDKQEVLVEAYNRRQTDKLIVTKWVRNADDSEPVHPHNITPFTFTLWLDPLPAPTDVVTYTVTDINGVEASPVPLVFDAATGLATFDLKHGDTIVINGIPTGTEYEVKEEIIPGYVCTSTGATQGVFTMAGSRADFVNTVYQDPSQEGKLIIEKEVIPAPDISQPQYTFNFYIQNPADSPNFDYLCTLGHGEHKEFTYPGGTVVSVWEEYPNISGYTPENKRRENITIPAQGEVLLTFRNHRDADPSKPGQLSISKTVATPSDANLVYYDQLKLVDFTFTVDFGNYDPGSIPTVSYTITRAGGTQDQGSFPLSAPPTFTLRHGEVINFYNIPHGVTYTVTELTHDDFTPYVKINRGDILGGITSHVDYVNRWNQDTPPPSGDPQDLIFTKLIQGKHDDADLTEEQKLKDFSFTLTLSPFTLVDSYRYEILDALDNVIGPTDALGNIIQDNLVLDANGQATFTLKPGQKIRIIDIPKGTVYNIREDINYALDKFRPDSTLNLSGTILDETVYASITNVCDEEVTIDISGEKTWDYDPQVIPSLPEFIKLKLMNGDQVVAEKDVFPTGTQWLFTFEDVPKYDSLGNVIDYTITEDSVNNFVPVLKEKTTDPVTQLPFYLIENVYVPPVAGKPITVKKSILCTDEEAEIPADQEFEFVLARITDNAPMPNDSDASKVVIKIRGEGEADFSAINFVNEGTYVYTITETPGTSMGWEYDDATYTAIYKVTYDEEEGKLTADLTIEKDGEEVEEIEFTNKFDPDIAAQYVTISGQKSWEHKDNPEDKRPDSAEILLLANGSMVHSAIITDTDKWQYSFVNLPRYDSEGKEIVYTVDETRITNYTPTIEGYDILNTYTPMAEVVVPEVEKKIQGTNPPAQIFSFILKSVGSAPMPDGSTGSEKPITISGQGTVNFGSIYFDKIGRYEYEIYEQKGNASGWLYDDTRYKFIVTVTEDANGLHADYELTKANGSKGQEHAIFTNLYNKAGWDEQVVIEGAKYWNHGDNPKLMRPTTIRVFLYGNGQYVAEKQVSEADGWEYMFIVPKYTAGGDPITYVIDELEIEGYTKHIEGYNLFNTYVGDSPSATPKPPDLPSFSPATGDNSNLPLWIGIFAASTVGMGILLFLALRKKGNSSKDKRD